MNEQIHPNPEKLRYMAREFEAIHRRGEITLDFICPFSPTWSATEKHPCGSVACHGGWAGAVLKTTVEDQKDMPDYFEFGADDLAKFLNPAWTTRYDFTGWAGVHPELWGNEEGDEMFDGCGYRAFGAEDNNITLQTIADHYNEVADRVQARIQTHLDQEKENVTL